MTEERSEQELVRFAKLKELRSEGFDFPNDMRPTADAADIAAAEPAGDPAAARRVAAAGRIVQMRVMGKAAFIHLLDRKGKFQVYVKQDAVGEQSYKIFKRFDIGDVVAVGGYVFITKTGEKTLFAESIRLLTKSLIPLPEKWHGLSDIEARYRYRYVDLIANPEVREVFYKRARIISEIRRFLNARDFLEVETPVLHYIPGGATARPFATHYNALHCDMYLRIALELPLKKLVVGGLERVYEIGRNFRNEGLSKKHNPEFTMIEFYQAYATFEDLMDLTEELVTQIVQSIHGSLCLEYQGAKIDFTRPWRRVTMLDSIHDIGGVDRSVDLNTLAGAQAAAAAHHVTLEERDEWGKCLDNLWEELVEPKLQNPVFITHHPFTISPLARRNKQDPKLTDRFELIIAGMEVANAFSELNDAEDQRQRLEAQAERNAGGDEEASALDEDFLRALEYGLPPTAGEGMGIDRLVMLLTDSASIRDVLLFPQLKPHAGEERPEPPPDGEEAP